MPTPGPISCQRRRSAGVPSANRGYQDKGTDTTRPSRNSTTNAPLVTRTVRAAAVASFTDTEIVMPRPQQCRFIRTNDCHDSIEFRGTETIIVRSPNRRQPELGKLCIALDVDVRRFVAITRKEKEPVRAALQYGRTHW